MLTETKAQLLGSNWPAFISVRLSLFTFAKIWHTESLLIISCVCVIYWIFFLFAFFQVLLNNYRSVVRNQGSKADELEKEFSKLNHDISALQEKVT